MESFPSVWFAYIQYGACGKGPDKDVEESYFLQNFIASCKSSKDNYNFTCYMVQLMINKWQNYCFVKIFSS